MDPFQVDHQLLAESKDGVGVVTSDSEGGITIA